MLPVLAITRPSSGVPTNRLRSDPGWPAWGRPATNGPPLGWRCIYASSFAKACGVTRLPAASPEPSSSANAVESIFTESVRNPRSTSSPAFHEPSPFSSRQDLEQHLREPVLTRVENRKNDVRERPAPEVDERRGAAAHRAVGERIGRAGRPPPPRPHRC